MKIRLIQKSTIKLGLVIYKLGKKWATQPKYIRLLKPANFGIKSSLLLTNLLNRASSLWSAITNYPTLITLIKSSLLILVVNKAYRAGASVILDIYILLLLRKISVKLPLVQSIK